MESLTIRSSLADVSVHPVKLRSWHRLSISNWSTWRCFRSHFVETVQSSTLYIRDSFHYLVSQQHAWHWRSIFQRALGVDIFFPLDSIFKRISAGQIEHDDATLCFLVIDTCHPRDPFLTCHQNKM